MMQSIVGLAKPEGRVDWSPANVLNLAAYGLASWRTFLLIDHQGLVVRVASHNEQSYMYAKLLDSSLFHDGPRVAYNRNDSPASGLMELVLYACTFEGEPSAPYGRLKCR